MGDNDDQAILVANEQESAIEDAGGFMANNNTFIAAALPEPRYEITPAPSIEINLDRENEPEDPFSFTYLVFYLLGIATMTPWNFFVTAEDYWMYKFRNTTLNNTVPTDDDLTPMQKSFTCDLTLTASISGTTFLILHAIYGQHISLRAKMLGTLTTILITFYLTMCFVEINTDDHQEQFFLLTLLTVIIMNVSSAVMSGAIFGIAGLFPSVYMTGLVSGQALGGIFTALAFILVLAFGASANTTAFIFFFIGSLLIFLSIISYSIMSKQKFFKYYLDGGGESQKKLTLPNDEMQLLETCNVLEPNIRLVFGKIYIEAVSICILFATTLSVYPAVTVLIQSENFGNGKAWNDIYFLPVVNYLFFNSGDYFGRIIAGFWNMPNNAHTVLMMTILRILYVPFFLCSNSNLHEFLPILVHSDIAFIIMIITFALSNGYFANILLMMAPRSVQRHEKEVASSIMAAALSLGLALGSTLSMVFVQML